MPLGAPEPPLFRRPAPVSAFFNAASGKGYDGRLFLDGEEGGTVGRPFGHVVATGDSFELTPWLGNMSFENVVAPPSTGDATVAASLDDGDANVGQQVSGRRAASVVAISELRAIAFFKRDVWGLEREAPEAARRLRAAFDERVGPTSGPTSAA